MNISIEQVKAIYRQAIDTNARDGEGADWWAVVALEVVAVIRAPRGAEAAKLISWWHSDWEWTQIGDSAIEAANRIREGARALGISRVKQ